MNDTSNDCSHLDQIVMGVAPSGDGCKECLETDGRWVHLRRCATCGHIGCCDDSPSRHAIQHARDTGHPIVQSYEPGEDWLWCYEDELAFVSDDLSPSPSHPDGWSPGPPWKFGRGGR
jgi:Zn-finger in ubiquitin-hydrolases and other protein